VVNGQIHASTPESGVLEGISRRTVFELIARLGIPCRIEPVPRQFFEHADEGFLRSTGGGLPSISRFDSKPVRTFQGPSVSASSMSNGSYTMSLGAMMKFMG
jgi:branched-chain amino acid aminotransferase